VINSVESAYVICHSISRAQVHISLRHLKACGLVIAVKSADDWSDLAHQLCTKVADLLYDLLHLSESLSTLWQQLKTRLFSKSFRGYFLEF